MVKTVCGKGEWVGVCSLNANFYLPNVKGGLEGIQLSLPFRTGDTWGETGSKEGRKECQQHAIWTKNKVSVRIYFRPPRNRFSLRLFFVKKRCYFVIYSRKFKEKRSSASPPVWFSFPLLESCPARHFLFTQSFMRIFSRLILIVIDFIYLIFDLYQHYYPRFS